MARPIKETPILHGEDARVFEARMKNPPKESREKMEEINRDYPEEEVEKGYQILKEEFREMRERGHENLRRRAEQNT